VPNGVSFVVTEPIGIWGFIIVHKRLSDASVRAYQHEVNSRSIELRWPCMRLKCTRTTVKLKSVDEKTGLRGDIGRRQQMSEIRIIIFLRSQLKAGNGIRDFPLLRKGYPRAFAQIHVTFHSTTNNRVHFLPLM
jgi:hypothetical protein